VPGIKPGKRAYMIFGACFVFFILNVLRIFYLGILYLNDSPSFEIAHKILWYFGSTLIILGIWFVEVKIFGIKDIPFYSDIKKIYGLFR